MITTLVQFDLSYDTTVAEAAELFMQTAPEFRAMPGLIRKYCMIGDHGNVVAACLWEDREAAELSLNEDWRRLFAQRYGTEPTIAFFVTPVVVDNALGLIQCETSDPLLGVASH